MASYLPLAAPDMRFALALNRPRVSSPAGIDMARVYTPPHHRFERLTLGLELSLRRPDLVHSPDFVSPLHFGSARIATIHDLAFLKDPSILSPDARRYYTQVRAASAQVSRVIAVSEATARDVMDLLGVPEERLRVVHNGIDEVFFRQAPSPDTENSTQPRSAALLSVVPDGRPLILSVGTIEPRKRHRLLLDALRQPSLRRDIAPLLVIVGQSGWRCEEIVERIEQAELCGDAVWLRDVSDADLRALYRRATVLALPSFDEGFGLPAVEAMASGLPVVAAERGALPEILGDAAVLVGSDDPLDWADVLDSVLRDEACRAALSAKGLHRARRYRWREAASATADVYREVLGP